MGRLVLLLIAFVGTNGLPLPMRRYAGHAVLNRRSAVSTAVVAVSVFSARPAGAILPEVVPGTQTQGLGQFVKLLERGRAAKDVDQIRVALSSLKLASDDDAVGRVINHAGSAAGHTATATYRTAATSTKVTVSVDGAVMTPEQYVKLIWIKEAESGKVLAVRDLAQSKLSETPAMLASIPKSNCKTFVPCIYCVPDGVFDGEPFTVD